MLESTATNLKFLTSPTPIPPCQHTTPVLTHLLTIITVSQLKCTLFGINSCSVSHSNLNSNSLPISALNLFTSSQR